jgi:hypothetical protein
VADSPPRRDTEIRHRDPAPEAAPPVGSPGAAGYLTLCAVCNAVVQLTPAQTVLAEARAIVGDLTVAFCANCIHEAARKGDC